MYFKAIIDFSLDPLSQIIDKINNNNYFLSKNIIINFDHERKISEFAGLRISFEIPSEF